MLHLHHVLCDPDLGTTFTQSELRTKDLIVVRSRYEGGRNDDALDPALTRKGDGWSCLRFVVEAPVLVRHATRAETVGRGEASASAERRMSPARSLTRSSDLLTLTWRVGGTFASGMIDDGVVPLGPVAREALFRLARAISGADGAAAKTSVQEAMSALRASGVPFVANASIPSPPRAAHEVARAIERVLCPLSSRPMATDLARELGVGERQALRRANAFFAHYCAGASTWRDYVHQMRVGLATFFMSNPRARTEQVSRLVGFASPTGLCHALHGAGLPSPAVVQRLLHAD